MFAPVTLFSQQSSGRYAETLQSTSSQNTRRKLSSSVQTDTVKRVYKEIVQELPAEKNALIKIVNTTCNLDIRPWPEAKVKLVTTIGVPEKDAAKITQEEMMEQAGITFKSFGNRVNLQTRTSFAASELTGGTLYRTVGTAGQAYTIKEGAVDMTTSIFPNSKSQVRWMTTNSIVRSAILYVPDGCRLDVNNKNTGIIINADIEDARLELSRSSLDARNFNKLFIKADYFSINISDVNDAELELENGNFTGGVIKTLDLDSKGSEIEYESGELLYVRSQNDRISLDEVVKVDGRKLFGDFRIGKLLTSLDLEGTNADIRIRNIAPTVELVKINDLYANLRIPVKNLTGFEVDFTGANSTVFASFEKIAVTDTTVHENPKATAFTKKPVQRVLVDGKEANLDNLSPAKTNEDKKIVNLLEKTGAFDLKNVAPVHFTASAGDATGKRTKLNISCSQCTVDFK